MAERAHPEEPGFRDRWFGFKKSPYKRKLYERYRYCNSFVREKTVLDIPCGTGWGTSLLKGAGHIIGLDRAEDAIQYAKKHFSRPECRFDIGDMAAIPLEDNAVDIIICLEGFEHVPRETGAMFLAEARRVLTDGGLMIMTCPVLNEQGKHTGNPYHLCEYDERNLIGILNENFRIRRLERIAGPDGPEYRCVLLNAKSRPVRQ